MTGTSTSSRSSTRSRSCSPRRRSSSATATTRRTRWAAAMTALMTGWAYRTSARIAEVTGPFAGFPPNRDAMLRVMRKHRAAADEIDGELVPEALLSASKQAWDEATALGDQHGYRNA